MILTHAIWGGGSVSLSDSAALECNQETSKNLAITLRSAW